MPLRLFAPMLLRESSSRIRLVANVIGAGRTASGISPLIATDGGGLWMIEYSGISLRTQAHIKTWRAIATSLDGGATAIIVPICDKRHGPFPTVSGARVYTVETVPHDDDTTHDDGTGYADTVIHAEAGADADLRATEFSIDMVYGAALEGGEYFSIEHPVMGHRLYEVISVDDVTGDVSTVTIRPPLREAVAAGEVIEFDEPKLTAQLASADAMSADLELRRFASAGVSFIEAFPPVET